MLKRFTPAFPSTKFNVYGTVPSLRSPINPHEEFLYLQPMSRPVERFDKLFPPDCVVDVNNNPKVHYLDALNFIFFLK